MTHTNAMTTAKLRTAVSKWFSNRNEAIATYGHISTWDTSGVKDMSYLFCSRECSFKHDGAETFNDDISAWNTGSVTKMHKMFFGARSFNVPIGGWDVRKVRDMSDMFYWAENFNKPLDAWDVSSVTDLSELFTFAYKFNRPLGSWRFDNAVNMFSTFYYASKFNQDLSSWRVNQIKNMKEMFTGASAFNQDLGWCVDEGVSLHRAFSYSGCESTSCGVEQGQFVTASGSCESTSAPTTAPTPTPTVTPRTSSSSGGSDSPIEVIAGAAAAVALLLAVGALWFYRRSKGSETEPSGGVDSPPEPKEPLEQTREEATALSVALEAEEILAEQTAAAKGWFSIGWFSPAEPEVEPESAPFPPEAEDFAAAEESPPLADWERRMNASEAAAEQGTGFQMTSALEGELEPEW